MSPKYMSYFTENLQLQACLNLTYYLKLCWSARVRMLTVELMMLAEQSELNRIRTNTKNQLDQ